VIRCVVAIDRQDDVRTIQGDSSTPCSGSSKSKGSGRQDSLILETTGIERHQRVLTPLILPLILPLLRDTFHLIKNGSDAFSFGRVAVGQFSSHRDRQLRHLRKLTTNLGDLISQLFRSLPDRERPGHGPTRCVSSLDVGSTNVHSKYAHVTT